MTMTAHQRWVLALTSMASLMIVLDALVVTTALHAIALNLHASIADLEWTVNAYILPFAVLLMAGAAGERYGRRRVLLGGLVLFAVGSAGYAMAPSLGWRQADVGHARVYTGIEVLERFVRHEPLRRVHECSFGVLALESEPVDPRL
jgi:MFS family permease